MHRYDPYALILDPSVLGLGRDAQVLASHGFEVRCVTDHQAADDFLITQGDRPGVGLVGADLDKKAADAVNDTLGRRIPGGAAAVVLVGEVLGRDEARHLGDLGFHWFVRRPFTPQELHLGVIAALGEGTWADVRKDPRVPVDLKVDVARPGAVDTATVCDLSAGGLFLAMSAPPAVGESLIIEMKLGARVMLLHASVMHCSHRKTPGRELGVGVAFERLDDADIRTIREYVEARIGSVRL